MGPDAMIFIFWMLSFKPTFSLSTFTFIKRLYSKVIYLELTKARTVLISCVTALIGFWVQISLKISIWSLKATVLGLWISALRFWTIRAASSVCSLCCCCCCWVASVVSDSVRPHRQQPTGLRCPWDSPGKNTGVGCHFLLQCMKVKSESEIAQSCPTCSDPMDCSPPGSSVHGIF